MEETGDDVFEAFDRSFAVPLGMEDWRVSDGYYHYERDKSRYPAYPFRLSARDAARFGLLFTREGLWGDQRVLSKHWVRRSSALYSIDDEVRGYGFMWWIYREPRFERYGMYAALGVGNQMIAALPEVDLVIVNRANTYEGQGTPDAALRDLVAQVLDARVGSPAESPRLVPLEVEPEPGVTEVPVDSLMEYAGKWEMPPDSLGLGGNDSVRLDVGPGHLVAHLPTSGSFKLYIQPDGSLLQEDSLRRFHVIRTADGAFDGIATADVVVAAAAVAAGADARRSRELLGLIENESGLDVELGRALVAYLGGQQDRGERAVRDLVASGDGRAVEGRINRLGYRFLTADRAGTARDIFALNTRLFPESSNVWDSLGEACMTLGENEDAIRHYEKSLELNQNNGNAAAMIARMRAEADGGS